MTKLTFDEFKEVINDLKKIYSFEINMFDSIIDMGFGEPDASGYSSPSGVIIFLINKIFNNDKDIYGLIMYWIEELEFGDNDKDGIIHRSDGSVVCIKTISELYDELMYRIAVNRRGTTNQ